MIDSSDPPLLPGLEMFWQDMVGLMPVSMQPELPESRLTHGNGFFDGTASPPRLTLSGSPLNMGRQHGELLGNAASSFSKAFLSSAMGGSHRRQKRLRQKSNACRSFMRNRHMDELEGLASCSDLTVSRLLDGIVFLDFYPGVLCSCIASRNRENSNEMLVGRNLEFPDLGVVHRLTTLTAYHPDNHFSFLSISFPGLPGVLTGINEHGLFLAVSEVMGERPFQPGLPYLYLHREILETCRTTEEAERTLRGCSRTRSNNLMVADPAEAAILEYDSEGVARRSMENNILFNTNHFESGPLPDRRWAIRRISSLYRSWKLRRALANRNRAPDVGYIFKLLKSVAITRLNLLSMVVRPADRMMYLRIGPPPAAYRRTVRVNGKKLLSENGR